MNTELSDGNENTMRNCKKGMTLVEVLLSIAIIGILSIIIFPVFTSAFMIITRAGTKSETIYQDQNIVEDKILLGATSEASTINIVFSGISFPAVNGEIVTNGEIKVFIPKE